MYLYFTEKTSRPGYNLKMQYCCIDTEYTFIQKSGEGSFGVVHKVRENRTEGTLALK